MNKKENWGKVPNDWHGFDEDEVEWFEERGCEVVKVECRRGTLLFGIQERCIIMFCQRGRIRGLLFVSYPLLSNLKIMDADLRKDACYTPATLATPERLGEEKGIFEKRERTVSFTFARPSGQCC